MSTSRRFDLSTFLLAFLTMISFPCHMISAGPSSTYSQPSSSSFSVSLSFHSSCFTSITTSTLKKSEDISCDSQTTCCDYFFTQRATLSNQPVLLHLTVTTLRHQTRLCLQAAKFCKKKRMVSVHDNMRKEARKHGHRCRSSWTRK